MSDQLLLQYLHLHLLLLRHALARWALLRALLRALLGALPVEVLGWGGFFFRGVGVVELVSLFFLVFCFFHGGDGRRGGRTYVKLFADPLCLVLLLLEEV